MLEEIKALISFVNGNLVGIIFLGLVLYLSYFFVRNYITKKQYTRENSDNDEKFDTMRCLEDGVENDRHYIYLVNKKSNPKTYQWIEDSYSQKQLGYKRPLRGDDKCFSKKEYKIKNRIKIYNIIFDIGNITGLIKDIKN